MFRNPMIIYVFQIHKHIILNTGTYNMNWLLNTDNILFMKSSQPKAPQND